MSAYTSSILVTGGTQSMGYHCSLMIAKQQPNTLVVISSRTDPGNAAVTINKTLGQENVVYMPLDLSSLAKVRDFAKRWIDAKYPPIKSLVFNAAGQWPMDIQYTDDGIEQHFAVNHVGHALLFHLLAPQLQNDARIVVVGSGIHDPREEWGAIPAYTRPAEVAQPNEASLGGNPGMKLYAASKLANVAWMLALASRVSALPMHASKTVIAMDPGFMPGSGMFRNSAAVWRFIVGKLLPLMIPVLRVLYKANTHTMQESGENLAWLVGSEEVKGKKGVYYEGRMEHRIGEMAEKKEVQDELWEWTVERVGESKAERQRFERLE